MGLFSFFKKKKNKKEEELNKKYLASSDKRYDENDIFGMVELYNLFKCYEGYEKEIDLSNRDLVYDKVNSLISELVDMNILCKNYEEFDPICNNFREIPLNMVDGLDILECLVLLTAIQRSDFWAGMGSNVYFGYTKNGLIPQVIYRIISLYESRVSNE